MRQLSILTLCLAASLALAPDSVAQRRRAAPRAASAGRPAPPRAAAPRSLLSTDRFNEDGTVTTLVQFEAMPIQLAGAARARGVLTAGFSRDGGQTPPKFAAVSFLFRSPDCLLPKSDQWWEGPVVDVGMLIDGQPLMLKHLREGQAEGVRYTARETEGGDCAETVTTLVSPLTLARIAGARRVTGKSGTASFELTPANLSALRELSKQIADAPAPR